MPCALVVGCERGLCRYRRHVREHMGCSRRHARKHARLSTEVEVPRDAVVALRLAIATGLHRLQGRCVGVLAGSEANTSQASTPDWMSARISAHDVARMPSVRIPRTEGLPCATEILAPFSMDQDTCHRSQGASRQKSSNASRNDCPSTNPPPTLNSELKGGGLVLGHSGGIH